MQCTSLYNFVVMLVHTSLKTSSFVRQYEHEFVGFVFTLINLQLNAYKDGPIHSELV